MVSSWYKVKNHLKLIQEDGTGPFPEIALKIDSGCFLGKPLFDLTWRLFRFKVYTHLPVPYIIYPIYLEPGVDRYLLATGSNRFQLHKELEDQGNPP